MAAVPAPIDLDDADSVEQTTVTLADTPHADPGLQPDCCPFLLHIELQHHPPPLCQQLLQHLPPPALNDPSPEGCMQQCASHQHAPPPGLDENSCRPFCHDGLLFWALQEKTDTLRVCQEGALILYQ
uniref:cDNA FLJ40152 fis, clone TESTI2013767 n=1 Tax=Homo sapiens TaxID=9606 RepID=Q8N809_HUMAN|nr:unnamed protein product [Homo sapiens]